MYESRGELRGRGERRKKSWNCFSPLSSAIPLSSAYFPSLCLVQLGLLQSRVNAPDERWPFEYQGAVDLGQDRAIAEGTLHVPGRSQAATGYQGQAPPQGRKQLAPNLAGLHLEGYTT